MSDSWSSSASLPFHFQSCPFLTQGFMLKTVRAVTPCGHFCLWDCISRVNWGEQTHRVILDRKSRSYMTNLKESAYIKPESGLASVVSYWPVLSLKAVRALKLLLTKWKTIALWLYLHLEDSTKELCKLQVIQTHKSASIFRYHSLCPANFPGFSQHS